VVLSLRDGCHGGMVGIAMLSQRGGCARYSFKIPGSKRGFGVGGAGIAVSYVDGCVGAVGVAVLCVRGGRVGGLGLGGLYMCGGCVGAVGVAVLYVRGGRVGGLGLAALYIRLGRVGGVGLAMLSVRGCRVGGVGLAAL
jgi:hypothetical protein